MTTMAIKGSRTKVVIFYCFVFKLISILCSSARVIFDLQRED